MNRSTSLVSLAVLLVGCGMQNSSFLTRSFNANAIPYGELKRGTIVLKGLDEDTIRVKSTGTRIDSVIGFSIDSLNQLYFQEFAEQLTSRFPNVTIVKYPDRSERRPAYLFNINMVRVINQNDPNFWVSPYGVDKALLQVDMEAWDMSSTSPLFRLQSNAEVMMASYSNPWKKAVQLNVTRIVDYIDSDGNDYTQK